MKHKFVSPKDLFTFATRKALAEYPALTFWKV